LICLATNPKRLVSEDSSLLKLVFPADCPHVFQIFTALKEERVLRSFGGVSRIWFDFTKASVSETLGPL
jgi:hypothetical protein